MNKNVARISDATPYIFSSSAITLLIMYYSEMPEDVAIAWTVVIMAASNYALLFLKPLYKKFEQWINR